MASFKQVFEKPIISAQDRNCSSALLDEGRMRGQELVARSNAVILRRPIETLEPYLPPKNGQVLFVPLTPLQEQLYLRFTAPRGVSSDMMKDMAEDLRL